MKRADEAAAPLTHAPYRHIPGHTVAKLGNIGETCMKFDNLANHVAQFGHSTQGCLRWGQDGGEAVTPVYFHESERARSAPEDELFLS